MLVFTRKKSEQIVIDDSIVVTVLRIKGGDVRLGFDAPRDVSIYREEIYALRNPEKSLDAGERAKRGGIRWHSPGSAPAS